MVDTSRVPPTALHREAYKYKAFLSYSHAADGRLAPALQHGLHRFAKPLFRVRAMRVFRDATNLAASPGLWSSIEEALKQSEHFVLLASPDSARSKWVQKEVEFWLNQNAIERLFIVLTDGEVDWNPRRRDFDWGSTTALPTNLGGKFSEEPLYLDLRWARTAEQLTLRNLNFRNLVADLAAPIYGRDKDELIGEDVRQQHHQKRIAWGVVFSLAALAVIATWQAMVAVAERGRALSAARVAVAWEYIEKDTDVSVGLLREVKEPDTARGWRGAVNKLRTALGVSPGPALSHEGAITNAVFGPDGRRVLTSSDDGTARLWEAATGALVIDMRHTDAIVAAEFNPQGNLVVTGSWDGTARVWDASTGRELALLRGHAHDLTSIAISPNGSRLVTGSRDNTARIWDLETHMMAAMLAGHTGSVNFVSFSPDGNRVVTASLDGTARLWDAASGKPIGEPLVGHTSELTDIDFSPDGNLLASSSMDGTVRLWGVVTGQEIAVFSGSADPIYSSAFNLDMTKLVAASGDTRAYVWDITQQTLPPVVLNGHKDAVVSAVFSPDGKRIVTASGDGTARLWLSMGLIDSIFNIAGSDISGANFSPDGSRVVVFGDNGAQILDILSPIDSLSTWLQIQEVDCLASNARSFLLGQSTNAAARDYEACRKDRK